MNLKDVGSGDLIAFQIEVRERFTSPNEGKWGVLKRLYREVDGSRVVLVLEGIFPRCPRPWRLRFTPVLREVRFPGNPCLARPISSGRHRPWIMSTGPNMIGSPGNGKSMRKPVVRMPNVPQLSTGRRRGYKVGSLSSCVRSRCSWGDDRPHILPFAFVDAARKASQPLFADVAALGGKPRRPAMRKLLRGYVECGNDLNGSMGYVIETEEREDIIMFLEEICWAVKQRPLWKDVDAWRDW